jgi:hypothetical protein
MLDHDGASVNLPECEWNELLAELERVTGPGCWMLDHDGTSILFIPAVLDT